LKQGLENRDFIGSWVAILSVTEQIRCWCLLTEQVRCQRFMREQVRCFYKNTRLCGRVGCRNPDIQPSSDVIAKALGESNNAYIKFINELAGHDIHLEWSYYNDGKAWLAKGLFKWIGVRGGQNETTVFWLSIWDGFFKVTIYVPEKARADVFSLPLDNKVKLMIADSKQMGKLKNFPYE